MITIGIDPHTSSHTAVALDEAGRVLGELRVPANKATLTRLQSWAGTWPQRTWAIEGAGGLGHLLASNWSPPGRPFLTCPPRSPHGHGCSAAATAARPTASTRTAWPR